MSPKINLKPAPQSPGILLAKAHGMLRFSLTQAFIKGGFDITPSHWGILRALWEKDNIIQSELAKRASIDRPNLTRILTKLEKRGFLTRKRPPNDNRSYQIKLTEKGRDAEKPLTDLVKSHLDMAFKGVSQDDYDAGIKMLRLVVSNINTISSIE